MRTIATWAVIVGLALPGCDVVNPTVERTERSTGALSQTAYGFLDGAGGGIIGGWAYDPDYAGPIRVHIYVDGALVQVATAGNFRPDLTGACPKTGGHCAFTWSYAQSQGFGAANYNGTGQHQVIAYAIGVDPAGMPDNQNPSLTNSLKLFNDSCSFLGTSSSAIEWCQGNPGYWTARQQDTTLLINDGAYVGVDKSYGGTIFQLRGKNLEGALLGDVVWGRNLLAEHGGAAMQLSLWGFDAAANTQVTCNGSPRIWNPIQAQGARCGWNDATNDVVASCFVADDGPSSTCGTPSGGTYYTKQTSPNNFTVNGPAVSGLTFEQWVTPLPGYAKVRYRVTADATTFDFSAEKTSPVQWDSRPQEIPALFSAEGVNAAFYAYTGSTPYTNAAVTVFGPPDTTTYPDGRYLELPRAAPYPHAGDVRAQNAGCATENWWGVCDANATRCITVATFDTTASEGWIASSANPTEAYLTPIGSFALGSTFSKSWSVYLFPYRYDQVPYTNLQTTRQIIYQLASAAGIGVTGRTCP